MKLSNEAQVLLERYLLGVKRNLPGKKGKDITEEVRSYLLDSLEEQYPKAAQVSEKQLLNVLEKHGSPRKLAAQYSPRQYLIGPRFFSVYLLVLKIVVPVVVGALTLALVIGALAGNQLSGKFPALEYLSTLWNGAFMSAAFVTLVFAIMERLNTDRKVEELEEMDKFDVNNLPQLSDTKKQPSKGETIFEMVAGVVGLAFFTYILNSGGTLPIVSSLGSTVKQIPVFTAGFMRFVPVLMVLTGLGIARGATLLVQGRRTSLTTWWQVADEVARFVVTVFMLGAFPLLTVKELLALPFGSIWDLSRVDASANLGLFIILIVGLVGGSLVTIIRAILRVVRQPAG
jgi:hypothetical protein